MEKLCVFCKHFNYERIESGNYSEWTSFDMGGMTCNKNKYYERRPYDIVEFRSTILEANRCSDYELDK